MSSKKHEEYFSENEPGNFYLYTSKSIYIVTNFHTSGVLHRGSELSYNYIINYLIIIIITY